MTQANASLNWYRDLWTLKNTRFFHLCKHQRKSEIPFQLNPHNHKPDEQSKQAPSTSTEMGTSSWMEGLIQRAGWSLGVISKMQIHCFQFSVCFICSLSSTLLTRSSLLPNCLSQFSVLFCERHVWKEEFTNSAVFWVTQLSLIVFLFKFSKVLVLSLLQLPHMHLYIYCTLKALSHWKR